MKTITVDNRANLPSLPLEILRDQYESNALKEKKNRDVGDLKHSILTLGFKVPLVIWVEGRYIMDGAGRIMALSMLEYEGYEIPEIPYIPVNAKTKKEAKALTLAISSQFGEITEESAGDFMLDMDEIDLGFVNLPGLNLHEIEIAPLKPKKEKGEKSKRGKTVLTHTCPNCHTQFTSHDETA